MQIVKTPLAGLLVIEPDCFDDERGFFLETYQRDRYQKMGISDEFVQDNQSHSIKGVLRGLHFQILRPQAQIVTVMSGRIFDVCVDLRLESSTFGKCYSVELCDDGPRQLYMAPGFAHGFCVLSDRVDLHYKCSRLFDPSDEAGLLWNDPDIGINWPVINPRISKRDNTFGRLKNLSTEQLPHNSIVEK
ncbi:MAG: dTDP-4-dehydrorhamnose 3,5-epimerase [Cohaesibacteraceae bacterium]|nr:dTDP-4-dehydrorhamnose 3,5-epimerase [Cohaesibacteraceae bacterium]MBL4876536.1 dTDP-4-dehydrorhamnose 3,5-epimerase [Cohaesibacteraceae bacterium]